MVSTQARNLKDAAVQLRRLGAMDKTRKELSAQFEAVKEGNADFSNPISRRLQGIHIREHGPPVDRSIAGLQERLRSGRCGFGIGWLKGG